MNDQINMSDIQISDEVLKNIRASIANMSKIDTSQIPEIKLNNSTESSITIEKLLDFVKVCIGLYTLYKALNQISETVKAAEEIKRKQEFEAATMDFLKNEIKLEPSVMEQIKAFPLDTKIALFLALVSTIMAILGFLKPSAENSQINIASRVENNYNTYNIYNPTYISTDSKYDEIQNYTVKAVIEYMDNIVSGQAIEETVEK